MDSVIFPGVRATDLKQIPLADGDVFHAMKKIDPGYDGFGEAYFSFVNENVSKGWKRHTIMTMNLVVPVGAVRFTFCDEDTRQGLANNFCQVTLSPSNYQRLTVAPKLTWMAFTGLEKQNLILNLASICHEPNECDNLEFSKITLPNIKTPTRADLQERSWQTN